MIFIVEGSNKYLQRHAAVRLAKNLGCKHFLCGSKGHIGVFNIRRSYAKCIYRIKEKRAGDEHIVISDLFLRNMSMEKFTDEPFAMNWKTFHRYMKDVVIIFIRSARSRKTDYKVFTTKINAEMYEDLKELGIPYICIWKSTYKEEIDNIKSYFEFPDIWQENGVEMKGITHRKL